VLARVDLLELTQLLEEIDRRNGLRKFYGMYPETGPLSRHAYPKHWEIFNLGATKPYRLAIGGNGVGKTWGLGCYETTCHATGLYPPHWKGKRYSKPPDIFVAGKTKENVRDIIQPKLIGRRNYYGTGMIPGELIVGEPKLRQGGGNDTVDFLTVRHVSGGLSRINFKAYEQSDAFEGFEADFVWLDEEPPISVYSECVMRGRTREPTMLITFTPLEGISDVVSMFLPQFAQQYNEAEYEASGRAFVMISQDEVPHLTDEERARMQANAEPHQREARRLGVPSIGSGKIYPVEEASFVIPALTGGIPRHWPRIYGMDVGLNCTAAVFGALDPDTDTLYIYSEHYLKDQLPPVHAVAIKARGAWIPGLIDPSSGNRNASDGDSLFRRYVEMGLNLKRADNTVSEGLTDVMDRLQTGRLKVVETCVNWIREFRTYRRDEKGRIVKQNDHAMDATRYMVRGLKHACIQPPVVKAMPQKERNFGFR